MPKFKPRLITHPDTGETRSLSEWANRIGITASTLHRRITVLSLKDALDLPKGSKIVQRKKNVIKRLLPGDFNWPAP